MRKIINKLINNSHISQTLFGVAVCIVLTAVILVSCMNPTITPSFSSAQDSATEQSSEVSSDDISFNESSSQNSDSQSISSSDSEISVPETVSIKGVSTFYPARTDEIFNNPGMGWVSLEEPTYQGHLDLGWSGNMPEVSNISLSTSWAMIEREDGVFDWSQTDAVINYWTKLGKHINFRICTDNLSLPYTYLGAPLWLSEKYHVPTKTLMEGNNPYKVHDYLNETYQQRLGQFLKKLMDRYGKNPLLDVVEIRGYGTWGEWHSGYSYSSYEQRIAALRSIVDTWVREWKSTKLLVVSASYEFRSEVTPLVKYPKKYQDFLSWSAFDYAMKFPEITFRRDGIATALMEHDQRIFADVLRSGKRVPNLGEFFGGYFEHRDEMYGYTLTDIMNAMIYKMRPNYSTVLGWVNTAVAAQAKENHWVLDMGNRWFGYRLLVNKAEMNSEIAPGKTLKIDTDWINDAMGRFWLNHKMKTDVVDSKGKIVASVTNTKFDPRSLLYGEIQSVRTEIKLPSNISVGTYKVLVSLVDSSGKPSIKLGMQGNDGSDRYVVGRFDVKKYAKADSLPPILSGEQIKKFKFAAGGTYSVSFVCKPGFKLANYQFGDTTSGYFFKMTTVKGGVNAVRGLTTWQDVSEQTSIKTVFFRLGNYSDYKPEWGSINYGTLSMNEFVVKRLDGYSYDFESKDLDDSSPLIPIDYGVTLASDEMAAQEESGIKPEQKKNFLLNGKEAVVFNVADFDDIDMAELNPNYFNLKPDTGYVISFRFKTHVETRSGGYYYLKLSDSVSGLANAATIGKWLENPNVPAVNLSIPFRTGSSEDYKLVFGIRHSGIASIDDITLTEYLGGAVITGGLSGKVYVNAPRTQKVTWPVQEGFEEGQFAATPFTMGTNNWGRMTNNPSEVISGNWSVLGRQEYFSEWFEYTHSNNSIIKLKKNTNYELKYKYKVLENGKTGSFFYTTVRSPSGIASDGYGTDTGFNTWSEAVGKSGVKRYTFNTGNYEDRYLIFGMFNGGAITIDDVEIREIGPAKTFNGTIDFEEGSLPLALCDDGRIAGQGAIVTSQNDIVISGKYSAAASAKAGEEWHEFLRTDVRYVRFKPNTQYKVTFKYKILRSTQPDGYIMFFARSDKGGVPEDVGLVTFTGKAGTNGTKTSTFTLKNYDDYCMMWVFHKDAAVSIDDIFIAEVPVD